MRNYRPAFIKGTTNVQTIALKEHAVTNMHAHALVLFKKQHAWDITEKSPIGVALLYLQLMDKTMQEQMKSKFNIAYMVAKDNLSFTKVKAVWALEEHHGADLHVGKGYKNIGFAPFPSCTIEYWFTEGVSQEHLCCYLSWQTCSSPSASNSGSSTGHTTMLLGGSSLISLSHQRRCEVPLEDGVEVLAGLTEPFLLVCWVGIVIVVLGPFSTFSPSLRVLPSV